MNNNHRLHNRRSFLLQAGKAGLAAGIGFTSLSAFAPAIGSNNDEAPVADLFTQKPLPYKYDALQPYIDAQTMELHYTKHAATYLKNLNEAVAAEISGASAGLTLESILGEVSKYSAKMRNNAGGHYNHELFWLCMSPRKTAPRGPLLKAINADFGSLKAFQDKFNEAAKTRFGSGWAWLYLTADNKLAVGSSPNQDNPLMDISEIKGIPLLGLDVWEHAYYLKYQNKRPDYITAWWNVVNWDFVATRYQSLVK
jgi:Fe-Mn family superoxide dismutase